MAVTDKKSPAAPSCSLTVALVGNPNTGKSTLFSALCGVPTRVGNYPGVTVEKKLGRYSDEGREVIVVDLPGTYSLSARTMDEMVSVDVLLGRQADVPKLDVIVAIVDATNLERNLYLFTQLRQLQIPIVLILNMWDRVQAGEIKIDVARLSERLGVRVICATASRSTGIAEIKTAIREVVQQAASSEKTPAATEIFPAEFQSETANLHNWLVSTGQPAMQKFLVERLLLDVDGAHAQKLAKIPALSELPARIAEARQRLAAAGQRVPALETRCRYNWIRSQLAGVVERPDEEVRTISDRIDHVLTHRFWGLLIFAAIMFLVFQSISTGASGMMDAIESMQGWLVDWVHSWLAPGTLRSLVDDGIIAGVGSVLVFLPQILILFFFIGLLEDCGYMREPRL